MKLNDMRNKKTRILLIDDDESFCNIYKSLLNDMDKYSVTVANSGKEGLTLARNQRPDVILLDILMPTLNGLDIACLLSCNESTRDIPLIFVTSLIEPRKSNLNNKRHYLGKPIDIKALIATIEEVLTDN